MLTLGLMLALVLPPLPGGSGATRWYTGSAGDTPRMVTESRVGGVGISGAGIDEVLGTAPDGPRADYCNYERLGPHHPPPCRAANGRWSWTLRGSPSTNHCSGVDADGQPNAPCNIHHFASNAAGGLGDRPWDTARFGPFPSFVVETDVTATTQRVLQGGWGFVCPLFADTTAAAPRTEVIEFCVEEWRFGTLFPTLPGGPAGFDVAPMAPVTAWRRGRSYDLDQVVTAVEPGRAFVTLRPGSETTWEGTGSHHLAFAISRTNMAAALQTLRSTWARDISEDPSDYAYVGIEEGLEGGAVVELGGSAANLSAVTTTDALYAGQTLAAGQALRSADGTSALLLRGDGDLVVYGADGNVRWAADTAGHPGARLTLDGGGDLVLTDAFGAPLWSSGTAGSGADALILGNGGELRLDAGASQRWASG